jgi:hypothetical protein
MTNTHTVVYKASHCHVFAAEPPFAMHVRGTIVALLPLMFLSSPVPAGAGLMALMLGHEWDVCTY